MFLWIHIKCIWYFKGDMKATYGKEARVKRVTRRKIQIKKRGNPVIETGSNELMDIQIGRGMNVAFLAYLLLHIYHLSY